MDVLLNDYLIFWQIHMPNNVNNLVVRPTVCENTSTLYISGMNSTAVSDKLTCVPTLDLECFHFIHLLQNHTLDMFEAIPTTLISTTSSDDIVIVIVILVIILIDSVDTTIDNIIVIIDNIPEQPTNCAIQQQV